MFMIFEDTMFVVKQRVKRQSVSYCSRFVKQARQYAEESYNAAMPRELVWLDRPNFCGWGCSQCAWIFLPAGPPVGETFEAMKRNFEELRDKAFVSHVCAKHPRKETPKPTHPPK